MLACPECRRPLDPAEPCTCGYASERRDGILNLMTAEQESRYAEFCAEYERVRREEGWGGEDLELPFEPRAHHDVWAVRRSSFKRLDRFLRKQFPNGGTALDVGAGNCWLTRHLDHWGFTATALDINDGAQDGLRAGSSYLEVGDRFERVRAPMESLPFLDAVFDLVVASGSLHYCRDQGAALAGFRRVLKPAGLIVVMDSPWYERKVDGLRAQDAAVRDLMERHGLDEALARRSSFLYRTAFNRATMEGGLTYRYLPVFPGWRRGWETLAARFYERRIAAFPLLVVESAN